MLELQCSRQVDLPKVARRAVENYKVICSKDVQVSLQYLLSAPVKLQIIGNTQDIESGK